MTYEEKFSIPVFLLLAGIVIIVEGVFTILQIQATGLHDAFPRLAFSNSILGAIFTVTGYPLYYGLDRLPLARYIGHFGLVLLASAGIIFASSKLI